jgi:hypothetical protein
MRCILQIQGRRVRVRSQFSKGRRVSFWGEPYLSPTSFPANKTVTITGSVTLNRPSPMKGLLLGISLQKRSGRVAATG